MKKLTFIFAIIILFCCSDMNADTIAPLYDTYTVAEGGQQNGFLGEFWTGKRPDCGHDENAMIYFDLSIYIGQQAESAILHINRFFGCPNNVTNADFFHATESWDESYNGPHIAHGSQVWANEIFNDNGWWEINILDLVQAWLDGDMLNSGLVMECHTGSGTSKFHSKDSSNESVRPYLEIQMSSAATPTSQPSITPTPTCPGYPTPTSSASPARTYVEIVMPSNYYTHGDLCYCSVTVHNGEDEALNGYPLCVVLEVYGYYYFAPSFSSNFDYYENSYPQGDSVIDVFGEFNWPSDVGSADNIKFLAALLNTEMSDLFGDMDIFIFGWGN